MTRSITRGQPLCSTGGSVKIEGRGGISGYLGFDVDGHFAAQEGLDDVQAATAGSDVQGGLQGGVLQHGRHLAALLYQQPHGVHVCRALLHSMRLVSYRYEAVYVRSKTSWLLAVQHQRRRYGDPITVVGSCCAIPSVVVSIQGTMGKALSRLVLRLKMGLFSVQYCLN